MIADINNRSITACPRPRAPDTSGAPTDDIDLKRQKAAENTPDDPGPPDFQRPRNQQKQGFEADG